MDREHGDGGGATAAAAAVASPELLTVGCDPGPLPYCGVRG